MLRTHTCGILRLKNIDQNVILCGWVQKIRDKGAMIWVDLRDRYGITQLFFEEATTEKKLLEQVRALGREYVIKATGSVIERESKNPKLPTGDIEIKVESLEVLNKSKVPPFTIEDETDGGEELRMKFRYLDLRRKIVMKNLQLRHKMMQETRNYLDSKDFIEVETPVLIKSTPEGARDFVVPSRMHPGEFYALPQSPQTFKQLLMVSGLDKYYQIVKCFRDEDLRADRQPEFTQIDCEMSFVTQQDLLEIFEELAHHLFKNVISRNDIPDFQKLSYDDAMKYYGTDKPDLRFEMKFVELNDITKGKGFNIFDNAELVVGICAKGCAEYSRKQLDALTDFVKKPQIGAKGLVYVKYLPAHASFKSSVDKFYNQDDLKKWAEKFQAKEGDLLLILAGKKNPTRYALSELRLEMGNRLGLRAKDKFIGVWIVDFPLLEWDEKRKRWQAMHHPFTSPKEEDIELLEKDPGAVKAIAHDMVVNGVELGGGSMRIYHKHIQELMFKTLGFTKEEARSKFGFLIDAFEYGAPPHGGIAFGFDRWCALMGGSESIRDYIAFPKNNAGRDVMIDSPSEISEEQLEELKLKITI